MVYRPDSGWGVNAAPEVDARPSSRELEDLRVRIADLEGKAKSETRSSRETASPEPKVNGEAATKTGGDQWISY